MRRFELWKPSILVIAFFLLVAGFYALSLRVSYENGILDPLLEWQRGIFGRGAAISLGDRREMQRKEDQEQLVKDLQSISNKKVGKWGIVVCDLESNDCFGVNQDEVFEAASVMKVLTACCLLDRVDRGELDLDQKLNDKRLYGYIDEMINRSDNDAWYALSNFLGYKNIQNYGEKLGMSKLDTQKNSFSPGDIALVLQKLYLGEIANERLTELLLSFMTNTETENRIPAGVPDGVVVYHKSGTFGHLIHDAGIVAHPKNPYVLVVMGKNTEGAGSASKTIAEISRRVWEYFDGI